MNALHSGNVIRAYLLGLHHQAPWHCSILAVQGLGSMVPRLTCAQRTSAQV